MTYKKILLVSTFFLNSGISFGFENQDLLSFLDSIEFDSNIMQEPREQYTAYTALRALTRACPTDEQSIIDAQAILRNDLYLYTHPINQRSLLDMPQYYFYYHDPCLRCCNEGWLLTYHAFFNNTPSNFYTQTSDTLDSYLALGNRNFVSKLDELGFDFNLLDIFDLIGKTRLTEYRLGLMICSEVRKKNWFITFRTPIEWLLRHFSLTESEKEDLQRALQAEKDEESEMEFAHRHLIADRFGMGDLRLNVGYKLLDNCRTLMYGGAELTLPLAWAFKKGLYGTHFKKNAPTPTIDLLNLLNLLSIDIGQAKEIGTNFLLAALNRLSRILLETGLGNNGHVGAGFFVMNDMTIRPKLHFLSRAAVEYLFPAKERRFYIKKKNLADFDKLRDPDPDNCEEALLFLGEQLVNTLFPMGFDTQVWPGFLVKISTALTGTMAKKWKIMLGYDFWLKSREMLGDIDAVKQQREQLRKNLAKTTPAFQNKIFASVSYSQPDVKYDWSVSLYGDVTFMSSGIGKDYNAALVLELLL